MTEEKVEKKKTTKTEKKEDEKEKEYTLSDLPGIGPSSIAKLEAAGIYDLMGVAVMTPAGLGETAGLGEAAARKAISQRPRYRSRKQKIGELAWRAIALKKIRERGRQSDGRRRRVRDESAVGICRTPPPAKGRS